MQEDISSVAICFWEAADAAAALWARKALFFGLVCRIWPVVLCRRA